MNKNIQNTDQLGMINKKIIAEGEILPVVQPNDGSRVQTATVATIQGVSLLANAQILTWLSKLAAHKQLLRT